MKVILRSIGTVILAAGILTGCENYGSVGGITDGKPAHQPAATEDEALSRCANMPDKDRQAECIAIVKQRFHDTSK